METRPPGVALNPSEPAGEPTLVFGPPGDLRGTLRLHNTTDERLRVLALPVEAPKLRGPAGRPLDRAAVATRLEARQQRAVRVSLPVDPTTPPGTYEGTVVVGAVRHPLRIQVCERLQARVEPRHVTLFTEGQLAFDVTYVVENEGNVPFPTGSQCAVRLLDVDRTADPLRRGLEGPADREPQEVFRDLLVAFAQAQADAGIARLTRENAVVRPGETRVSLAHVALPAGLRAHRHYVGRVDLYGVEGRIDVYTGEMPSAAEGPRQA